MQIVMDDKAKIAEIWLTKAESNDPAVEEKLKPFYQKCKAQKYLAVVYRSGTQDLFEATRDLLCYNYNNSVTPQQVRQRSSGRER